MEQFRCQLLQYYVGGNPFVVLQGDGTRIHDAILLLREYSTTQIEENHDNGVNL